MKNRINENQHFLEMFKENSQKMKKGIYSLRNISKEHQNINEGYSSWDKVFNYKKYQVKNKKVKEKILPKIEIPIKSNHDWIKNEDIYYDSHGNHKIHKKGEVLRNLNIIKNTNADNYFSKRKELTINQKDSSNLKLKRRYNSVNFNTLDDRFAYILDENLL